MKNLFININLIQDIEINPKDQILEDLEVRIKLVEIIKKEFEFIELKIEKVQ